MYSVANRCEGLGREEQGRFPADDGRKPLTLSPMRPAIIQNGFDEVDSTWE